MGLYIAAKITGPLAKECELLLGEMLPEDTGMLTILSVGKTMSN